MFRTVKNSWAEFREFAFKGNMIDLAIAVVIGAAFSGVINSLVKDIIMPGISYVTSAAQTAGRAAHDVATIAENHVSPASHPASEPSTQATPPAPAPAAPPAAAPPAAPASADGRPVQLDWMIGRFQIGHFVAELLNFLLVAFAVFLIMVKVLGSVVKRVSKPTPTEPTTRECPFCLSNIPFKARKCAHCTADMPDPAPSA